jgi:hypothetical protein
MLAYKRIHRKFLFFFVLEIEIAINLGLRSSTNSNFFKSQIIQSPFNIGFGKMLITTNFKK